MVPQSAFLTHLYSRSLPPEIPLYLFFSYSGRSGIMDENNDGAVTLESQLDYRVQHKAQALYGFNEDHVNVLFSEDVVASFNATLKERADALSENPLRRLFHGVKTSPSSADQFKIERQQPKPSH
jgi:hypothetical protein